VVEAASWKPRVRCGMQSLTRVTERGLRSGRGVLEDEGYLSGQVLSEMVFNCGRWIVDGAQQEALNFLRNRQPRAHVPALITAQNFEAVP
jgi:hypothetical protein